MNPEAKVELDRIVTIEPVALSEAEVSFLRARRDYLSEEQKAVYAEVLAGVETPAEESVAGESADEDVETTTDAPTPGKKSKK